MDIHTGVDVVSIDEFTESLHSGGESFLRRLFLPQELTDRSPEHLAGLFAAKEAVMKALPLPAAAWHAVSITVSDMGKPTALITDKHAAASLVSHDLSITHAAGVAVAVFVAIT
ncbi:4'-phosphopantetheinyl transferase superfamily protein [Patescibacteria group bacterium]|nr:4'-phosphopantetheinyl transferase superfamily protein [Patescibacteria group bacterium]